MKQPIYLDYAAATPIDGRVRAIMEPYYSDYFYNPSAIYLSAKKVAKDIVAAREKVGKMIGARPSEIIFTAGGTEANNLAVQGILRAFPDGNIVSSTIEHDSVLEPVRAANGSLAMVKPNGLVDIDDIKNKINDRTVMISIMYVNNEIGTVQPMSAISELVNQIRTERKEAGNKLPLYLHTDACQAGNYLNLLVDKLGVDMMTINSGKLYGPKQAGALYVKSTVQISPLILGGGQERNMRSGTENVANIVGFAEALKIAQDKKKTESLRMQDLRKYFVEELKSKNLDIHFNSLAKHTIPNNVHVTFADQDNERLMMALDEQGVMCAVGSACSASSDEPSHVLSAIGLSDNEARSSLRFTMGRQTIKSDIDHTIDILAKIIV